MPYQIVAHQTLVQRLKELIEGGQEAVFLRSDFAHLGSVRQVSRALTMLHEENVIARVGYGIYVLPDVLSLEATLGAIRNRLGYRAKRLVIISGITVAMGEERNRLNLQTLLDAKKLATAERVVRSCTVDQIRQRSLANLQRWRSNGTWVSAFDEWRILMEEGTDQDVISVMIGTDERCNRLRQSPPYVGLVEPVALKSITRRSNR